ncbi:hypothetical protein BaRGS_00020780, partial [Batillaria attramentaria]
PVPRVHTLHSTTFTPISHRSPKRHLQRQRQVATFRSCAGTLHLAWETRDSREIWDGQLTWPTPFSQTQAVRKSDATLMLRGRLTERSKEPRSVQNFRYVSGCELATRSLRFFGSSAGHRLSCLPLFRAASHESDLPVNLGALQLWREGQRTGADKRQSHDHN